MQPSILAALAAAFALSLLSPAAAETPGTGPNAHPPTPRYASLRAAEANGRRGPGTEHQIDWVYTRAGLPVQITAESGPWRRVRDPGGVEVWMHAQNLAARRTAYVSSPAPLRRAPRSGAAAAAQLGPGVIGALTGCEGRWRRIAVGGRVGWVDQSALWGADDCAGL